MIPPGMPDPNCRPAHATAQSLARDESWRSAMRNAIRSARELCELLGLAVDDLPAEIDTGADFPVLVPRSFAQRMRYGDARDPLLQQVLALRAERTDPPGYSADPLHENAVGAGGVLRKYSGRALLITTAACPVHCRYCFRRHFPYSDQLAARDGWTHALQVLQRSPDIHEVILSGGDPLSHSTARLQALIEGIEAIDTIRTLRIHTRFPIIVPARMTHALTDLLCATRLKAVVVVHCNHANELRGDDVTRALQALRRCTDAVLNQSVLLRGVNDSATALCELSHALFRAGVLPYYLSMLDRVSGSAHFEVSEAEARSLMAAVRAKLPGYLVPRRVREVPGALSKTALD